MPTFIDCHRFADVSRAVRQEMHLEAVWSLVDQHGVQPLAHWLTNGVIYCVVQAPSDEAVCQHHADHGLSCDDLHGIVGLRGRRPLLATEIEILRAAIAELWPGDQRVEVAS
jgi:hypothetical protein